MRGLAIFFLLVLLAPAAVTGQALQAPSADQGRLRADHVRYDAKAKVYLAEGNVQLTLGDVQVRAERLRLEQNSQTLYAFGDVSVVKDDVVLTAATITYDLRTRLAHALGQPALIQDLTTIRATSMEFDLQSRRMVARGGVRVTRKDVVVRVPELRYDATSDEALAMDVVVEQPGRAVRAGRLRYLPRAGRMELEGNVVVEQESGERFVEEGVIERPGDDEGKQMLVSRATLTCDRLILMTEERTAQAEGSVTFTQQERSASSAAASYSDRDRRLIMTGAVVLREEGGRQLRADHIVFSLADETVEATGNVVVEFTLKRGR